ncbi:MAG TPA: alpha/beta fold hydrolase [Acidobacteriaceae bacterium]|jgi:pimeloyl-ACP methyl ester carboxylesterase
MKQETPQPEFEERYVDAGGLRVHYLHAGSGRPILLLHGLVGSSDNWRGNIAALTGLGSVYAIDLVNMGKSQRVLGLDAGLRATARRIVAIMDALGIAQADVVAHSYGGAVALMLAATNSRRVRRLVLFAPANPYSRSSDLMVRVYSTRSGALLLGALPYLPQRLQRMALGDMYGGADRVGERSLREIVEGLRSPGTRRHVLCVIRCWFAEMGKLRTALRRVRRIPMLLVWGDRDFTVGFNSAAKLQRRLRNAELVVVPGGTHSVFEDMPEEANRILLTWLGRPMPVRGHAMRQASRQKAAAEAAVLPEMARAAELPASGG